MAVNGPSKYAHEAKSGKSDADFTPEVQKTLKNLDQFLIEEKWAGGVYHTHHPPHPDLLAWAKQNLKKVFVFHDPFPEP